MSQANVRAVITADDRASGVISGVGASFTKLAGAMGVGQLAAMGVSRAFDAVVSAGKAAVTQAASFEQTRIGLENMLGSADKARVLLSQISKFAAETPFEFPELAQATRQLVAFGFSAEEAFDTMKQLGDVSAAVGTPINDIAYLMGTLRTQGRAFTIDIRQFAQRGIPIYEYLAKVFQVNTNQLTELIETGKVGFPEVQRAFQMMTAEGGKFHGAMAAQSKSLSGLFSTLKDTLGQVGRSLLGLTDQGDVVAGGIFDRLRNATSGLIVALSNNLPRIKEMFAVTVATLTQFFTKVIEIGTAIGTYLMPKFQALINTISANMPTFVRLWQEVLAPLANVLGQVLVMAIGFAIDALNALVAILAPVIGWMLENKTVTLGLAAAFGILAVAMNFNAIGAAFNGAMAAVQGGMAATQATVSGLAAALGTAAVAFGVLAAAAVVAAAVIISEGNKAKAAWDNTARSIQSASKSNDAVLQNLQNLQRNGTPDQQQRAKATLKGLADGNAFAAGTNYAPGGWSLVGEEGPELVNLPRGSKVLPNGQTPGGSVNITIQAGAFMGNQQDARTYAVTIANALNDYAKMNGTTAAQLLGG